MNRATLISIVLANRFGPAIQAANAAAAAAGGFLFYNAKLPTLAGYNFTDDAGTLSASIGSGLGNWKSREGSAAAAVQATPANCPILTAQSNGVILPVHDASDRLDTTLPADLPTAETMIFAGTLTNVASTRVFMGRRAGSNSGLYLRFNITSGEIEVVTMNGGGFNFRTIGAYTVNTPIVVSGVSTGAAVHGYRDGALIGSNTFAYTPAATTTPLGIGDYAAGATVQPFVGKSALVFYAPSAISDAQRTAIENLGKLLLGIA